VVQSEHLLAEGRKMAKSAGNIQRPSDLAAGGIEPLALRYLVLTARYGHKIHAPEASLRSAAAALASLRGRLQALGPPPAGEWASPEPWPAPHAGGRPTDEAKATGGHGATRNWTLSDRAHRPTPPLSPAGRQLHDDLNLPAALAVVRRACALGYRATRSAGWCSTPTWCWASICIAPGRSLTRPAGRPRTISPG
jgi:cysteinyl-tRNA synthetase